MQNDISYADFLSTQPTVQRNYDDPTSSSHKCKYARSEFNIAKLRMPVISFSLELNYLNVAPGGKSILANNDFLMLLQNRV